MAPRKRDHAPLGTHFLKQWREFKNLRQEDVAEKIGYNGGLLSKVENSKIPYTQRSLEALARLYGTTPSALISINPLDSSTNQLDCILSGVLVDDTNSIYKLLSCIKGISPTNIETFVGIISNTITANNALRQQNPSDGQSDESNGHHEAETSRQ